MNENEIDLLVHKILDLAMNTGEPKRHIYIRALVKKIFKKGKREPKPIKCVVTKGILPRPSFKENFLFNKIEFDPDKTKIQVNVNDPRGIA